MSVEDAVVWVGKLSEMDSPNTIAEFLKSEGVTGHLVSPGRCVVAEFLWEKTGVISRVRYTSVETQSVESFRDGEPCPEVRGISETSKTLGEFLMNFDRGNYPELTKPVPDEKGMYRGGS